MIPIKLTIEGIYSYQKPQTIDFTRLTDAGLFGIFGAVGSGKSSILEAISFALYGETERLNARDSRAYNMMNLKSNRAYIEFDFLNHENKIFRISREFRRNSKKFEDVKSSSTVFYEKSAEEWKPLDHTNAEILLGLTYDNFKRSIIIPQGQFKEFLELKPTERTTMLMEIFKLHKFDLAFRTKNLSDKNKTELDLLLGKLSGFEEVSAENLEELDKKLKEELEILRITKEKHEKLAEDFKQIQVLREEFKSLQKNLERLELFKKQKERIESKKLQLKKYEETHQAFSNLLKDKETYENEIHRKSEDLAMARKKSDELEVKQKETEVKIRELSPEFENLEKRKEKENDFGILIKLKDLEANISNAKSRLAKGKKVVEQKKKEENKLKESQNMIKKSIEDFKKSRMDAEFLMNISAWYQKKESLQIDSNKKQKALQEFQEKIKSLDAELKTLKIKPETYLSDIELERNNSEALKTQIHEREAQLKVQQKLGEFAHTLVDGQPCLLCGSMEHPRVYEGEDISAEFERIKSELKAIEENLKQLTDKENQIDRILNTRKIYQDQISQELTENEDLNKQILEHKSSFIWNEFDPENIELFEEKRKISVETERKIKEKEKELEALELKLNTLENQLETYERELNKLENEEVRLGAEYNSQKSHLKQLEPEEFTEFDGSKLNEFHQKIKLENQRIEKEYRSAEKDLQDLKIEIATAITKAQSIQIQINETVEKLKVKSVQISENIVLHKFNSVDEVYEILNLNLNPANIRREIEDFEVAYKTLQNKIEEQNEKLKHFEPNDEVFEAKKHEFEASTKELDEINKKSIQTETEFNRLQKSFEEKRELLDLQEKLLKRADNLEILRNLFMRQGFVQYVSGIYLRQLCDNANIRFHRMTRNQLSLQVNEKLEFEIVDYLNEGRSRSVKTLSGGQSFQVSLSLALALAENVQNFIRSDKNFFFIDEGFGTQDSDSVNIVFETLLQLQKENRIVGIISHVEELKEKMPVALQVIKDEEKGSWIEFV
ncbi:MAG: SMC family ATPase [Flavobacteriaceae bacterium]|jgi:exonuclease SbcC|nr:SMC family ATPase [Flavobacteriaceae bacterium]